MHGGARKDVRARGDMRAVAAQLGLVGLEPAETVKVIQRVLSDQMLRAAGALAATAEEGRPVDPVEHERFVDASDRALVAARVALSAGVTEVFGQREQIHQDAGELLAKAVGWAVDAVLKLAPLDGVQRTELRVYGLSMAQWAFEGAQSERPKPPTMPVARQDVVVSGELLPGPRTRRGFDADEVWARAAEIVDGEVLGEEDDDVGGSAVAG